jgi:hypothetical protein
MAAEWAETYSKRELAMFSKEFGHSLNQALSAMQQDEAVRQTPVVRHLTIVLRTLWHEVQRLERHVSVSENEVVIKTGGASVVMKSDGSVVVSGNNVIIEGSGNVAVKAGGRLVLKGSQILQN